MTPPSSQQRVRKKRYTLSLHDALPIRSEERRVGKECVHNNVWFVVDVYKICTPTKFTCTRKN